MSEKSDSGRGWRGSGPPDRDRCTDLIEALLEDPGTVPGLNDAGDGRASDLPARVELLGRAVWDVFSRNHTVVDPEGHPCDLGSFRGSAGVIAEAIHRTHPEFGERYGYLDFYMGASLVADADRLRPIYRWIFERLEERGYDWRYSFPRLYLFRFSAGPGADDDAGAEDFLSYDPSDAFRADRERDDETAELESLREELERRNEEAIRRARHEPLPPAVAAYREVYGTLPEGWPHPDM